MRTLPTPGQAGRRNLTSFQANSAEATLPRKPFLFSERLGLSSFFQSLPKANPLRRGFLCAGKGQIQSVLFLTSEKPNTENSQ